ncbi:MAG TPA: SAM-dependent methyltransferase [Chitinophagaceae bacterium]|nr:SAM-dependent methyltransferase [Chitinophagaceae bacterium]
MSPGKVYLLPCWLDETGLNAIPAYVREAVADCQVFFVENERSARRYLKQLWKEMVIDDYEWYAIHKAEQEVLSIFRSKLKEGKNIGILSEAGCPGVADPGQLLIAAAQEMNAAVRPLTGPSSVLLALMASGLNGQRFQFLGYLPIDNQQRVQALKESELESQKKQCTQIFIETPYRNNQLLEVLLKTCRPETRICIAADITGEKEWIKTRTVAGWKKEKPELHKRPVIFLLLAG